jgi:hypothetical protein
MVNGEWAMVNSEWAMVNGQASQSVLLYSKLFM